MALLLIAVFQTCDNSKLAASPNHNRMKVANDFYATNSNQTVDLNILQNDSINLEKSTVVFASPKHGKIINNAAGTGFSYAPAKNFKGRDYFEYRVCLGEHCETALVTLVVN